MAQGERGEDAKRGMLSGLFGDLSVTQLVAGALAAATSLLLSTKIGIAGSVIGVAVGSIVSAVAGAVYKQFLQASADKLKEVAVDSAELILPISKRESSVREGGDGDTVERDDGSAVLDGVADSARHDYGAEAVEHDCDADATMSDSFVGLMGRGRNDDALSDVHGDALSVKKSDGSAIPDGSSGEADFPTGISAGESGAFVAPGSSEAKNGGVDETQLVAALRSYVDASVAKAHKQWLHEQQVQRRLLAVSILSALVAVGATALLVFVLTSGQGLGEKTPIITPIVQAENAIADSVEDEGKDSQQQDSDDAAADKDASKNKDAASSDGSDSGDSTTGSGSDVGSDGSGNSGGTGSSSGSSGDGGSGGSGSPGSSNGSGSSSGSGSSGGSGNGSGTSEGAMNGSAGSSNASGPASSGSGASGGTAGSGSPGSGAGDGDAGFLVLT